MGIRTPFDPLGSTGNQKGLPFTFTIDTTKNTENNLDNTFVVPLAPGTYSSLSDERFGITWGDGNITVIDDGIFTQENCTHTYAEPGQYTISLQSSNDTAPKFNFYENYASINNNSLKIINTKSGIIPQIDINGDEILVNTFAATFRECSNLTSITADLFKNSPNITVNAFVDTFHTCTNLRSIPINLFRYNTKVTTNAFNCTFCNCFALTTIPTNLFRYNTEVSFGAFVSTFYNCRTITSIPDNLFLYNTKVSESGFNTTFGGCTNLTTIPTNLFYTNTLCTSFIRTFIGCTKLTINPYIFGNYDTNPSLKTTRFNNDKTYNFSEMFYRDTFTGLEGTSGTPGDFWTWTYQQTPTGTDCYGGLGNVNITNYKSIPVAWGGPALYRVSINVTAPNNCSILLQADGYTQVDNYIDVHYGTTVTYTVSHQWYYTITDTITVTDDTSITVSLNPVLHDFTISPEPAGATVILEATGYTQSGNTISVPYNTVVDWTVSYEHYQTLTGEDTVYGTDITKEIQLTKENYTFDITVLDPPGTTIIINDQERSSITVPYDTTITWSVDKTGYVKQEGYFIIDQDVHKDITLYTEEYTAQIIVTNVENATIKLNGVERSSITAVVDTIIHVEITKPGYITIVDEFVLLANTIEEYEMDLSAILTINVLQPQSGATIVLESDQGTQQGNQIEVVAGSEVTWTVSAEDYVTQTDTIILNNSDTINVTLAVQTYRCTIIPDPDNATVTLTATGYPQVQGIGTQYIDVEKNTTVNWEVSKYGYDTRNSNTLPDEPIYIVKAPITQEIKLVGHTYVDVEDYTYTETSSSVIITGYTGSGTVIEAPHLEVEV